VLVTIRGAAACLQVWATVSKRAVTYGEFAKDGWVHHSLLSQIVDEQYQIQVLTGEREQQEECFVA
jgi:hypothetical protein